MTATMIPRPHRKDGTFDRVDAWVRLFSRRVMDGECWVWTGTVRARGTNGQGEPYGGITHEGRRWLVHRLAFALAYGEIPQGLVIDHICHRTLCFRPDHLRAVTQRENAAGRDQAAVRDSLARGRLARWGV